MIYTDSKLTGTDRGKNHDSSLPVIAVDTEVGIDVAGWWFAILAPCG